MTARTGAASSRRPDRLAGQDDAELFRRMARGDVGALGILYDRHAASVRTFARRAAAHDGDGDDLAHETFLTAMRIAAGYDGRASARSFLIGVAAQLARRHRHRLLRAARRAHQLGALVARTVLRTPEDISADAEELERFERAVARLSEQKRLVLAMVDGEGLSSEEAAELLAVPAATVRTRLHYARQEVRAAMSRGKP